MLRYIVEKIIRTWSACLTGALGVVHTERGTDLKGDTRCRYIGRRRSLVFSRQIVFPCVRVRASRSRGSESRWSRKSCFSQLLVIRQSVATPSNIGRTIWMLHGNGQLTARKYFDIHARIHIHTYSHEETQLEKLK